MGAQSNPPLAKNYIEENKLNLRILAEKAKVKKSAKDAQ